MFGIIFFVAIIQFVSGSCPSGFSLVRAGQCRGKYATISSSYNDEPNMLVNKCKEMHGAPVIIHDEEDQVYYKGRVLTSYYFGLGIVCNSNGTPWRWSDGSVVDYKPPTYDSGLDTTCVTGCGWYLTTSGSWSHVCSTSSTTFDVYCTTQLEQPAKGGDGCENFDDDSEDGVCYQIGATAESWEDARITCKSFGADLASIHNPKENAFIRRVAVSRGAINGVYIGAKSPGDDNTFEWVDGSDWDNNNFYNTFPVAGLGKCAAMDTQGTSGQWVNVDCSSKLAVACMRQQNYSEPTCSPGPWKEGQIIYSPGFPNDASIPCDYLFSVTSGRKVEVEVLLVEANSCCDRLVIIENYIGGTVLANLTGEVSDKTYTTKSSNFMRVSWQPEGGINVRGFMMRYREVF